MDGKIKTKKTGGILRSMMTKTPTHVRDGRELQRDRQRDFDTRSDISDLGPGHTSGHLGQGSGQRVENTYRLDPDPDRRFRPSRVEAVMRDTLSEFLTDVEYDNTLGQRMSKLLSDTIKTRVKEFKWTRYKVVVQVIIGENKTQDIRIGSRFLWNDSTDTYASTQFVNKSIFALAICFGVYMD